LKTVKIFQSQAGWREVGGKRIFFRSRWEFLYANHLQWQLENMIIKEWEYEPKTFWFESIKRGVRSYKPDFRVLTAQGSTIWYEVKGYMDQRSKTKLARFKRFFPDEKIVLINRNFFQKKR
jgi:hypothetical protein